MEKMDIDSHWHLVDIISLQDAAALLAGYDPNEIDHYRNDKNFRQNYPRLNPVEKSLRSAVASRQLEIMHPEQIAITLFANVKRNRPIFENMGLSHIQVKVDVLRKWLEGRGFKTGFFFQEVGDMPDFLDPRHKNYAPKLAAAIRAWQAVSADPKLVAGKTVKQALLKHLSKNADRYGLTKDDGSPNEQAMEEIAKIANWVTKGGAPKTPG